MDKYRSNGCLDIEVVVVVAGDGEVPHPAVALLRDGAADHGHSRAVRGLEALAFRYFVRKNPFVQIRCVDWTNGTLVMNLRTP